MEYVETAVSLAGMLPNTETEVPVSGSRDLISIQGRKVYFSPVKVNSNTAPGFPETETVLFSQISQSRPLGAG